MDHISQWGDIGNDIIGCSSDSMEDLLQCKKNYGVKRSVVKDILSQVLIYIFFNWV